MTTPERPFDDAVAARIDDRDLALMVLRGRAIMRDWADWRRNPDHYAGVALTGVFTLLRNRLRPEAELATEDRGTPKEFHDLAAGSGRLPIGLVERTLFGSAA